MRIPNLSWPTYLKFAKFIIAGGFNTVATFVIFWMFLELVRLPYPVSSILTWFCGIAINFLFLRLWVFQDEKLGPVWAMYRRHFLFHALFFLLNLSLLIAVTELSGRHPLLVQAVLLVFLLPLNFILTRLFVVGSPHKVQD